MFNSSSEVLSPCLRRFVLRGCLVPNLLELNLWEDGRLSLTPWSSFLSLLLFPLRRTGPHEIPDSLPGDGLAPVVVTAAFSSLRKAPLPWLMVYFLPWRILGRCFRPSFLQRPIPPASDLPSNLGKTLLSLSWPLIPFTVEKELFYYLSQLLIKSSFYSLLHFSYHVGALPSPPADFPFLPGKDTCCVYFYNSCGFLLSWMTSC